MEIKPTTLTNLKLNTQATSGSTSIIEMSSENILPISDMLRQEVLKFTSLSWPFLKSLGLVLPNLIFMVAALKNSIYMPKN